MLLNNFFYIDSQAQNEQHIDAGIRINEHHEILKGHFPEQPVVPGVCMLEMLKEVLQISLTKKLMMTESSMMKFLNLFTPQISTKAVFKIDFKINESAHYQVNAALSHEDTIFFKFKGIFAVK